MKVEYVAFPQQFKESSHELMTAVQGVFERGDFILGQDVELFEQEFAKISKVKHAVSVANGTDSLIIAMRALGIGPGDEVITASNSWISSASSIALLGATPVFADVDEDQNISVEMIENAITSRTKAIVPVHLTGRCADMTRIMSISKKHGIPVIEDAAQSVMGKVDDWTAGNAGLCGSFSLHPLKNLNAAGDAGVLTTNDDDLAKQFRLLRNHGQTSRDVVAQWGYNSRLDSIQAAVLRTRIKTLEPVLEKRRAHARQYIDALKNIVLCPTEKSNEYHTYHTFVIQCDRRDELRAFLATQEIDCKIHYPTPIHLQKAASYLGYKKGSLPQTEKQAERILSLPIHQFLDSPKIAWVAENILKFYGH